MASSLPTRAYIEKFVRESVFETGLVLQLVRNKNVFIAHDSVPPSGDYEEITTLWVDAEQYILLRKTKGFVPRVAK